MDKLLLISNILFIGWIVFSFLLHRLYPRLPYESTKRYTERTYWKSLCSALLITISFVGNISWIVLWLWGKFYI